MRIRIEGLDEFRNDLNKSTKMLPDVMRQAMDKATTHVETKVEDKITTEKITFQGGLQQSVYKKTVTPYKGEVGIGKKYGIFVEKGTRPHWPPREPLEKWGALKLGKSGMGFVLARKIARVGTKAHPYFEPAVNDSIPGVIRFFEMVPEVLVKIMAGKTI